MLREDYERDGFVLMKGLFSKEETRALRERAFALHAEGRFTEGEPDPLADDPLKRFPRMMHPHRGDDLALGFLLSPRSREVFREILGQDPLATQTMIYFKPPGARGQAFHQDQRYLQVHPGSCHAAWLALEPVDVENGCLQVVRGSHRLPVLCPIKSDIGVSFTSETVPLPPDAEIVDVVMEEGDCLFFHGNLIHGSPPNLSPDRFRTIIAAHYAVGDARTISRWYSPVLTMDGEPAGIEYGEDGSRCGTFVDASGRVEMTSTVAEALAAH